jgi:hypothetical protein
LNSEHVPFMEVVGGGGGGEDGVDYLADGFDERCKILVPNAVLTCGNKFTIISSRNLGIHGKSFWAQ